MLSLYLKSWICSQLLKAYVVKYANEVPARDLQHSSTEFVKILLDKLGDSNVRSKDAAAETLMFLASKKELGLDVVAKPLLRPAKNQVFVLLSQCFGGITGNVLHNNYSCDGMSCFVAISR